MNKINRYRPSLVAGPVLSSPLRPSVDLSWLKKCPTSCPNGRAVSTAELPQWSSCPADELSEYRRIHTQSSFSYLVAITKPFCRQQEGYIKIATNSYSDSAACVLLPCKANLTSQLFPNCSLQICAVKTRLAFAGNDLVGIM